MINCKILRIEEYHMKKKLLVLRHAKSTWAKNDFNDHERKLNERGIDNSKKIAQFMEKHNFLPDYIICSSAKRALMTLEPIVKKWTKVPKSITQDMYLASPEVVLSLLKKQNHFSQILLVGHNPGLARLVTDLIGNNIEKLTDDQRYFIHKFPTCSLAIISLSIDDWSNIGYGIGNLEKFIKPEDII